MVYRRMLAVSLVALLGLTLTCTKDNPDGATGIKGQLILQTGQTGDVRNCRVQLFISSDLTGNPVKEVASAATGVDQTKSDFTFEDVLPNYYYLVAWKDLNGNGKIDHLDIVGVNGGTYRPGYGGTQITVIDKKETDVGQIVMNIYKELKLTVSAARDAEGYVNFTYSFNDDCTVITWTLTGGPLNVNASDNGQAGAKTANTQYHSDGWYYDNSTDLPPGSYTVTVVGSYNGNTFTLASPVSVP